jgi:hypothetical protein
VSLPPVAEFHVIEMGIIVMTNNLDIISENDAEKWGGDEKLIDLVIVNDEIVGIIPIERLGQRNPLINSPWFDGPEVTRKGVEQAIAEGRLEASPYPEYSYFKESDWDSKRHEERIAYLTVNKDSNPISVEFICRDEANLEVQGGWHRIAAAIMREDKDINVAVGGWFRHSVSRLGAICRTYCKLGSQQESENFWNGESEEHEPLGLGM